MICGAVEITPCSVRHSAVSRTQSGDGYLVAGLREIETTGAAFEQVEGALVEGVGAVRDAGAERIGIFASGELRGTRVAGRISVEARRLGLGEVRFTGTGAMIAADFIARSGAVGARLSPDHQTGTCGVLGIGHRSVGLAVGPFGQPPSWIGSRPIGVATLAERSRLSDPPEPAQIEAALAAVERSLGGLSNPGFDLLVPVSDFSLPTRLFCGDIADADSLRLALDSVAGISADELGARTGLGPVLAPLFPLALAIQYAAARVFPVELVPLDPDPAELDLALAGNGSPGA